MQTSDQQQGGCMMQKAPFSCSAYSYTKNCNAI